MSVTHLPGHHNKPKAVLKVTDEMVEKAVAAWEYHVFADRLTVCVMHLHNGFIVTGESCCVDACKFDKKLGEEYAFQSAVDKVWMLQGYALKQRVYESAVFGTSDTP